MMSISHGLLDQSNGITFGLNTSYFFVSVPLEDPFVTFVVTVPVLMTYSKNVSMLVGNTKTTALSVLSDKDVVVEIK